jgi:broad specificity phosphatase PhoE
MIYMMRHFKVKDTKKSWMDSTQFEQWVKEYDTFDLDDMKLNFPNVKKVYTSTCKRAIRTADVFSSDYLTSDLLVEVDAKAFIQTSLPLPKWLWLVVARIQWYLNVSKGENRVDTIQRIEQFFHICDMRQDMVIVTHGFVMKTIIKVLKKHGFYGNETFSPRNGAVYSFQNLAISE